MLRIPYSHQNYFYTSIAASLALVNTERDKFFNFTGIFRKGTCLSTLLCLFRREVSPRALTKERGLQR